MLASRKSRKPRIDVLIGLFTIALRLDPAFLSLFLALDLSQSTWWLTAVALGILMFASCFKQRGPNKQTDRHA